MRFELPPQQSSSSDEGSGEEEEDSEDELAAAIAAGAGTTVPENRESMRLAITPTKAPPAPPEVETPMLVADKGIASHLGEEVEACIPQIPVDVDFDEMEPQTNDFNLQGIMKSIVENPIKFGAFDRLGTLKAQAFNTEKYEKQKMRVESEFSNMLASHEAAKPLAEFIEDPNDSSRLKRCLIVLCQGPRAPHKQNLLNWALCLFSLGFVKKKFCDIPIQNSIEMYTDAQYEPGTVANYLRILFAVFSRRGVPYSQTKDFRQG